jgi:DNA-binding SARP family transcriptional activator
VCLSPSSQRLVCYLALQNRSRLRTQVSSALWLDSTKARANASLRSALWRVGGPTGEAVVQASSTHVWLNPAVFVDLHHVIERANGVLDDPDPGATVVDVARSLVAFGEDVLPGWEDDWVIMERERFRQLRLHVLERLGERLLLQRRCADAVQVALACVQAEPLRESAHRLLIRVHQHEGNVAGAIRQYRAYAALLAAELGAHPSPAMERLLDRRLAVT